MKPLGHVSLKFERIEYLNKKYQTKESPYFLSKRPLMVLSIGGEDSEYILGPCKFFFSKTRFRIVTENCALQVASILLILFSKFFYSEVV